MGEASSQFWIWMLVVAGLILALAFVAYMARKLLESGDGGESAPLFTLADLRQMRDAGTITQEQFESLRDRVVAQSRGPEEPEEGEEEEDLTDKIRRRRAEHAARQSGQAMAEPDAGQGDTEADGDDDLGSAKQDSGTLVLDDDEVDDDGGSEQPEDESDAGDSDLAPDDRSDPR